MLRDITATTLTPRQACGGQTKRHVTDPTTRAAIARDIDLLTAREEQSHA